MELKMEETCEVINLYTYDGYKLSTKALTHLIDYKWRMEQAFEVKFNNTMNKVLNPDVTLTHDKKKGNK